MLAVTSRAVCGRALCFYTVAFCNMGEHLWLHVSVVYWDQLLGVKTLLLIKLLLRKTSVGMIHPRPPTELAASEIKKGRPYHCSFHDLHLSELSGQVCSAPCTRTRSLGGCRAFHQPCLRFLSVVCLWASGEDPVVRTMQQQTPLNPKP